MTDIRNIKKYSWLQTLEPGTLVRPKKTIYLTPLNDPEEKEWLEWSDDQVGVVVPLVPEHVGICVMTSNGFGICFFDEIKLCQ